MECRASNSGAISTEEFSMVQKVLPNHSFNWTHCGKRLTVN
jgi:hypothetical protein